MHLPYSAGAVKIQGEPLSTFVAPRNYHSVNWFWDFMFGNVAELNRAYPEKRHFDFPSERTSQLKALSKIMLCYLVFVDCFVGCFVNCLIYFRGNFIPIEGSFFWIGESINSKFCSPRYSLSCSCCSSSVVHCQSMPKFQPED